MDSSSLLHETTNGNILLVSTDNYEENFSPNHLPRQFPWIEVAYCLTKYISISEQKKTVALFFIMKTQEKPNVYRRGTDVLAILLKSGPSFGILHIFAITKNK